MHAVTIVRKPTRPESLAAVEYRRRVAAVRQLLESFQRQYPYTDNVAKRIVTWAETGFRGEP